MSAKMGNFSKSLSHMETPLKVVRCSQSLCGVPYFRSPTGDVVVVVVDVAPIWMLTPHNVLVASLVHAVFHNLEFKLRISVAPI